MDKYRKLESELIVEQIGMLSKRINERFPESGLYEISRQCHSVALKMKYTHKEFLKPNYWIRSLSYFLIVLIIIGVAFMIYKIELPGHNVKLFEFFQIVESGINDIVFIAIAIYFLFNTEARLKRKKALAALEELRTIIHVIDMHQLSKDPQMLMHKGSETESSPKRTYSSFELGRYFDYCSELLALIAKIAALYIQNINDQVILSSANDLESLSSGISQKIWQKIMILPKADFNKI
jgi:hypothetical protein